MECTICVLLPICFAVVFFTVYGAVYYLSVFKYKLVPYKTPFFCEAGAKKPAYWVFSIGITICSLLIIATVIIQYIKRNECWEKTTVDSNSDIIKEFKIYNLLTMISGICCGISLCGMGLFSMHTFYTAHMILTGMLMAFTNLYMPFTTVSTTLLSSNEIDCIDIDGVNINAVIIGRWIIYVFIAIINAAVFGVMQYALELKKKQNQNENLDEVENKVRSLMRFSAIGQYTYLCGFVLFFLQFIPTMLL